MDPLFIATPSDEAIYEALSLWPELAGRKIRPLLVSAFGDIYVETDVGDVWVADPIEISCYLVAGSVNELQNNFANPAWAEEKLITNLALLANDKNISRDPHQVFGFAPHPSFTGELKIEQLMPMDVNIWHHISLQLSNAQQNAQADPPPRG